MTSIAKITVDESSLYVLDALVPHAEAREAERQEIARLTKEFLARGGKIQRIKSGFSGAADPAAKHTNGHHLSAGRNTREVLRVRPKSPYVGVNGASAILAVNKAQVYKLLDSDNPPPHTYGGHRNSAQFRRDELIQWGRENGYQVREDAA